MREDCSVCECPAHEVPQCWDEKGDPNNPRSSTVQLAGEGPDRTAGIVGWNQSTGDGGGSSGGATYSASDVWTEIAAEDKGDYVNLLDNPEGYTGYGTSDEDRGAQEVWKALYAETCFHDGGGESGEVCQEERVFHRLLSGLHASISTHIAITAGGRRFHSPNSINTPPLQHALSPLLTPHFTPSLLEYISRVGAHRERLSNLYFTYLFVARAVEKSRTLLSSMDLSTGSPREDEETRGLLRELLQATTSSATLSGGFDEKALFTPTTTATAAPQHQHTGGVASPDSICGGTPPLGDLAALEERLRTERRSPPPLNPVLSSYRSRFQNISRVLDCVGCDRCRLWGKVQFLGLGTAVKVLFAEAEARAAAAAVSGTSGTTADPVSASPKIHLSRDEVVALINVFHRLSVSIATVEVMRDLEFSEKLGAWLGPWTPAVKKFLARVLESREGGGGGGGWGVVRLFAAVLLLLPAAALLLRTCRVNPGGVAVSKRPGDKEEERPPPACFSRKKRAKTNAGRKED